MGMEMEMADIYCWIYGERACLSCGDGMHGVWVLVCLFYNLYTSYFLGQKEESGRGK
jgi:hypothetical protein